MPALPTQECTNDGTARDVVNDYHQHNHFPRPPDPSSLHNVRHQQHNSSVGNPCSSGNQVTTPSQANGNRATSVILPQADGNRATLSVPSQDASADVPPGPLTGSPAKFQSYPHKFHTVIKCAKQISQCECALVNPFPSCADFLDRKSAEHFTEAIAETQHVPQGK